jgi:hypothetical protein
MKERVGMEEQLLEAAGTTRSRGSVQEEGGRRLEGEAQAESD